jgi:hypothetical protein
MCVCVCVCACVHLGWCAVDESRSVLGAGAVGADCDKAVAVNASKHGHSLVGRQVGCRSHNRDLQGRHRRCASGVPAEQRRWVWHRW